MQTYLQHILEGVTMVIHEESPSRETAVIQEEHCEQREPLTNSCSQGSLALTARIGASQSQQTR